MDRLIIESILADVNEIFIANDNSGEETGPAIVLGFKAKDNDQIIHAFTELKKLAADRELSLVICKTMVSGMCDLELLTDALDEPVRICNKVITSEMLGELEDYINKGIRVSLTTNVSEEKNRITLGEVQIKECTVS